jgi:4-amino-4-deoxy-L-arabinose transferase-like glycosyltransferase
MSLIAIPIVFVVLAVVLLLAWRTVRFFIKLALVGALLLALLVGLGVWRWQANTNAPRSERQTNAPARRNR